MADIKAEYLACPIRQVVSRFGDKWPLLVSFLMNSSETGVMRSNEIRHFMTDCSPKMLSQTLKSLEQSHLVHREVYRRSLYQMIWKRFLCLVSMFLKNDVDGAQH